MNLVITLSKNSKFYGIKYPIFCLKRVPYATSIRNNAILIKKIYTSDWSVLDEYRPDKPFLSRYLTQDTGTFTFDYTCYNITHLISNKIEWGIDSNARIFNLKNKQKFKAQNLKVRRAVKNIIWLDRISYPFELNARVVVPQDITNQWATMVHIDHKWELYKFYSFPKPVESILL